jgi:3-hydroxybutyryl-CoA dehydrogenase
MAQLTLGILGTGVMGKQVALLCASHNIPVYMWNHVSHPELEKNIHKIALFQARLGTIDKDNIDTILTNINYVDDITKLRGCNLLFEAVTEDIAIKSDILRRVNSFIDDKTVVSSNTSTLSITYLASLFNDPTRFIGVHFFNPPLSMKLTEVVRGEYTSENTVLSVVNFLSTLQKLPVVLPETPGFVVNRLLFPMINEAIFLLAEGVADEKTIDNCMKLGANHPMGPLELADLIGLDVCLSILETLVAETGDSKYRPAPILRKNVRAGKLGRKSGEGFYTYRKKG